MPTETQKSASLSLPTLTALVVGSMIGGGIFSVPQGIASRAGAIAGLIAWGICAIGMLALALIFQSLSVRKPQLNAGVFAYARAGFGEYIGFLSALGYWAAGCLGNVSFLVLYKSTMGAVVPAYGAGNTPVAILTSSLLLWGIHYLLLRGVKQAAVLNVVTTVAKVSGILVFVGITAWAFDFDIFRQNLRADPGMQLGDIPAQVARAMYVAVFIFLGIESANTYSRYARERRHVGIATITGFLLVLALVVAVSMFSFGVLPQAQLAELRNPSTALVLKAVVGGWGAYFISIALIVSLLGAFLSWTLVAAEVLFVASNEGSMPKFLGRQNRNDAPAAALWLTNGLVQVFLIVTLFAKSAYLLLLDMTSSMAIIPYLFVAAYGFRLAQTRETYGDDARARVQDLVVAGVAMLFSLYLLYVGGMKYLLLSTVIYGPGIVLFIVARRERNEQVFGRGERALCLALIIAAVVTVYGLVTGSLNLS
jgi:arginine:ornithine antiporter/lysine permease